MTVIKTNYLFSASPLQRYEVLATRAILKAITPTCVHERSGQLLQRLPHAVHIDNVGHSIGLLGQRRVMIVGRNAGDVTPVHREASQSSVEACDHS